MNDKNKIWMGVGIVIVLLLIVVVVAKQHASQPSGQPAGGKTAVPTLQVKTTNVPTATLPQGFPSDIPIESGAMITQNYNATAANGLFQATRVFVTKKSLDDNFTIYSNYLKSAGWTTVSSLNLASVKVLAGKKGGSNLQITISQNSVTKQNTVDISYSTMQ